MAAGRLTLERLLHETGMTKSRFAQFSGVHRTSLAKYLNGSERPTLRTIQKLAAAFRVSVPEMTGILSEPRPSRGTKKRRLSTAL